MKEVIVTSFIHMDQSQKEGPSLEYFMNLLRMCVYKIFAFFLLFFFLLSHHGNRRHVDFHVKTLLTQVL